MNKTMFRFSLVVIVLLCPAAGVSPVVSFTGASYAQEKPEEVKPQEQIKFEQDKAQAHMKELEERMFELAKLIRESQPDDSARLLMGVQRAREHLIAERMGEAATLLTALKLEQAVDEQRDVIDKLEEIKKLLLTADIGLEVKLEQLRKLREAREGLSKLAEAEKSQLKSTEAELSSGGDPTNVKNLEPNERRNQRKADDLEQLIKQFGNMTGRAAASVASASQSMGQAGNSLGQGQGQPATPEQQAAIKKLSEADQELAQAEEQLKKELEGLVRRQVMEHLIQMIAQQKQVRETNEKLLPRIADGSSQALVSLKRLGNAEEEIVTQANGCIELCELTEFSVAFPTALRDVVGKMELVRDDLRQGIGEEDVIFRETEIEADLEGLLMALKQASKPNPNGQSGECMGCKGNLNKLLAELKMVRQMEQSLQHQTRRLDDLVVSEKITEAERAERCAPLQNRQEEVLGATTKIAETYGGQP